MKKIFVFVASAALVLSTAAVSMAAPTFSGDYRYNMYDNEASTTGDKTYGETDLRLRVTGNVSDTVNVTANYRLSNTDNNANGWTIQPDDFIATATFSKVTAKMGWYEYNFTPSRVELTSSGLKNTPKNDGTFEVDVPLGENLSVDAVVMPFDTPTTATKSGSYALAVNYKTENFGAKVSYWAINDNDDLTGIDVYYMLNENMKLFVDATDYSVNNGGTYDKGFDPVIGLNWQKIADTNLFATVEYAINPRNPDAANEWNEYYLTAGYQFNNGIRLIVHHATVGDDQTKDMLRFQYKF